MIIKKLICVILLLSDDTPSYFLWGAYNTNPKLLLTLDKYGSGIFTGTVKAEGTVLTSDERLKDISKRDGDVAYFKWKSKSDEKEHIGYIAQEVEVTNPEQVTTDSEGMKSVNYIEILVQKVRELEKVNEKQSELINDLLSRVIILENKQ